MSIRSKPFEPEKPSPYLPNNVPPLVMEKFEGMDTYTTRSGVDDAKCWWIDGFMCLNERNLRTLYGPSLDVTFDVPISFFGFANIGSTPYCIVIHTDGSVDALNTSTLTVTAIAATGTIQNPSRTTTGLTQYGSQYVLIITTQTDGYFVWDGTTFYKPGDTIPTVGVVPNAISGTGIETYQGRVWIINGAALTFSAPGSIIMFGSGGGGTVTSTDSFLRVRYTSLVQTNGFLYLVADSSISYISGVQTSGTPPTTVFTLLNADPEVGSPWPASVTTFGRSVVFANAFGAHINYGAAVTKISDALNGVYNTVPNFGGFSPSSAKSILFGVKVWMLLLPIVDPYTGQQVNKLMIWDGKKWFASGQGIDLTYIQHQEIDSVLTAWGTDGTSLYRLMNTPSASFQKVVQSKFWDRPVGYQIKKTVGRLSGIVRYYSFESPDVSIDIDNELGPSSTVTVVSSAVVPVINASNVRIYARNASDSDVPVLGNSAANTAVFPSVPIGQNGYLTGITVTTSGADLALVSLMFQPEIGIGQG